jgi:hypothetical protein
MNQVTLEIQFLVPNFVTPSDVYTISDKAAALFTLSHIEIVGMALYGLPMEEDENG